jgi:hypothetical protein
MNSESGLNTNTVLKTTKIQENINYNINNINNGNNNPNNNNTSKNMNINSLNIKVSQQDKKITQNKIIGQNIKTNGFNNMKSLDSSKETISTKNFNGKKFIFNDKIEKNDIESNITNEENSNNNLNRFTKIGKDPKLLTKQIDKVKNIFSSKIADN